MNFIELVPSYFLSDTIANVIGQKITGIKNANIYLRSLLFDDVRRGKVHPSEILSFLKLPGHLQYLNYSFAQGDYSITMDFIRDNPEVNWIDLIVRDNPNFTLNDLDLFTIDEPLYLNDKITFQDFLENPDLDWLVELVIADSRVSRDLLLENIDNPRLVNNPGFGGALFMNKNLNEDDLRLIIDKFDIDFNECQYIEDRDDVSIEFIEENYELFENCLETIIENNKNMTEEFIENHFDDIYQTTDDLSLGHTDLISLEFLSKHKYRIDDGEGPKNYYPLIGDGTGISISKNLTMDDIHKYPDLPWNFDLIIEKSNIDVNEIMEEITMYFNGPLLKNPNFKITDYPNFNKPAYYISYSKNPGVKMDEVEELDQGYWNFEDLSSNLNMTFDFYNKYKDPEVRKAKFPNSEGEFIPEEVLRSLYFKERKLDREEQEN